ncbi:MAG: hypothetical protein IKK29_05680 [Christensenellaceae bacterium]|nr:hypothetical protein [Christensenellaceae bacterium]
MKTDREKLLELLDHATEVFRFDAWENTDKIADYLIEHGVAIPVRCKDCKYYGITGYQACEVHSSTLFEDDYYIVTMEPDDFCSYGERKEK